MPFPLLILLLRLNFFPLNLGAHSRATWVRVLVLCRKQYTCVDISLLASASVQCYSSSIILPISTVCIVTWVIFACRESLRAFSHAAGFVIIIQNKMLHNSNFVSRDEFSRPVPRQPAHLHTQAESGAYVRDSSQVPRRRPFICLKPPYAIGSVPSFSGHAIA